MRLLSGQIVPPLAVTTGIFYYKEPVILTTGCYDLLHIGHVNTLRQAKELGGILLVALNSDTSVKRLKGAPIHPLETRMAVISSLRCVDLVTWFEEDTPLNLIKKVKPKYLVKGGDYKASDVCGYEEMKTWNGEVKVMPFIPGMSPPKLAAL